MLIPLVVALQLHAAIPPWRVLERTTIAWRAEAAPYEVLLRGPRFPDRARRADETAAPVVAFVVDTTGRIELPTASFLNYVAPDFQHSICEMLPNLRFEPLVLAGQKLRVLFVQFYGFNSLTQPDEEGLAVASALMHERQETYATQPVENVIPELERLPHCDSPKGK